MLFKLFNRPERSAKQQQIDEIVLAKHRRAVNRERVYRAIATSPEPVNMRTVAAMLGQDSGCISPRIAELHKKGRIEAIKLKPTTGKECNYYRATR